MQAKIHPSNLVDLSMLAGRHSSSIGRLQLFAEVCRLGFQYVPVLPELDRFYGKDTASSDSPIQKYANDQSETLFDLHNLMSVRIWGILEAFVSDIASFLIQSGAAKFNDKAVKTKIPLSLMLKSDTSEYAEALLGALEQSVDASLKPGVGRFEATLDLLGASGSVDSNVRSALFKCSKIRNCIVHKDSIVDQALVDAIPELKDSVGKRVGVTWIRAREFFYAACWYILEIQERLIPDEAPPRILEQIRAAKVSMITGLENASANPSSLPFPNPSSIN